MGHYKDLISDIDFSIESKRYNDLYNAGKISGTDTSKLSPWMEAGKVSRDTDEFREFSRENMKNVRLLALEKKVCPHCNSEVSINNYSRTHGDQCNLYKSGHTIQEFMSDYHNGATIYRLGKTYGMGKSQVKRIISNNK